MSYEQNGVSVRVKIERPDETTFIVYGTLYPTGYVKCATKDGKIGLYCDPKFLHPDDPKRLVRTDKNTYTKLRISSLLLNMKKGKVPKKTK